MRIDVSIRCLDPTITVLGPAREWGMTRPELMDYLSERGIELPLTKKNPYSIDENLWGRAIECGELEDPWTAAPDDAYQFTVHPWNAPDQPQEVVVSFEAGHTGRYRRQGDGPRRVGRDAGQDRRFAWFRPRGHGREPAGGHQEP